MKFESLDLSEEVLKAVNDSGYTEPTPIQAQAIPEVMKGRDVLGTAQTGTGKTASFVLPMLTVLGQGRSRARMPRSLILEPTRELAAQVADAFEVYGKYHKLSMALLIGGVSFADQLAKLDRGVDVLIATPGRLLDHFERGKVLLNGVQILVIDEADRMLDMGFIPDVERIAKLTPFTRQTLFFSATMPPEIQRLSSEFLHNPAKIEVARRSSTAETVTQKLVKTSPRDKSRLLRKLLRTDGVKNAIIFCNRKRDVAALHKVLKTDGFNCGALHGDLDQHTRMKILNGFREGEISFLVASDVAARGLDIPAVSHIFNYDVPTHAEDYVHRIGRTGRAGREGTAFTFMTPAEEKYIRAVEHLIEIKLELVDDTGKARSSSSPPAEEPAAKPDKPAAHKKAARKPEAEKPTEKKADPGKPVEKRGQSRHEPRKKSEKQAAAPRAKSREAVLGLGDHMPAFLQRPARPEK